MNVYIQGAAQISIQKPLCNEWLTNPIVYHEPFQRALEADYKPFIDPMAARRMGKILKRAIATSFTALKESGLEQVDAVITGTGLGCIENTEKFLEAMVRQGEELLPPTYFINSTHNTVSAQIALALQCHGYNSTYAHLGISFQSALLDALLQLELGQIQSALVGGHDEMTPTYFALLDKVDHWKGKRAGEAAVSFVLSTGRTERSLAQLHDVCLLHAPTEAALAEQKDAMIQRAGVDPAQVVCPEGVEDLFGHSFTVAAYELYAALYRERRPQLLEHHDGYGNVSLILVSPCSGL